jgi:hypothetical protein
MGGAMLLRSQSQQPGAELLTGLQDMKRKKRTKPTLNEPNMADVKLRISTLTGSVRQADPKRYYRTLASRAEESFLVDERKRLPLENRYEMDFAADMAWDAMMRKKAALFGRRQDGDYKRGAGTVELSTLRNLNYTQSGFESKQDYHSAALFTGTMEAAAADTSIDLKDDPSLRVYPDKSSVVPLHRFLGEYYEELLKRQGWNGRSLPSLKPDDLLFQSRQNGA